MEDNVQLVIEIPEAIYEDLKSGKIYSSLCEAPQGLIEGIRNGTPLPKGHGRLIDADALYKDFSKCTCKCDCNFLTCPVCSQKVIIEADKGESEGEE